MADYIEVRGVKIGAGIPKICVPVVGTTGAEIKAAAEAAEAVKPDVVEWRADWFSDVEDEDKVCAVLKELRKILGEIPLLFTFRTKGEGGERALDKEAYVRLNQRAAESGLVDLIDAELFTGEDTLKELVACAHAAGVKVIASNHDFKKTPEQEVITERLLRMKALGADIPKIAVMPEKKADVLTLLLATVKAKEEISGPIITMSMAGTGLISRISGEAFGSALTFGTAGKASAPGQMDAKELRQVLTLLHENMA